MQPPPPITPTPADSIIDRRHARPTSTVTSPTTRSSPLVSPTSVHQRPQPDIFEPYYNPFADYLIDSEIDELDSSE
jgi:hypothetical protein